MSAVPPTEITGITGLYKERTTTFAYPILTIGREQSNGLAIPSDLRLSRNHAQVAYSNDQWVVQDLNSTNGTFINGDRISPGKSAVLRPGDIITCGAQSFRFNWVVPPPPIRQFSAAPPVVSENTPRAVAPPPNEPVVVIPQAPIPLPTAATKIPPKRATPEPVKWILPGQVVTIAGRTITAGLFFLGRHMVAENGYDIEPSLIDDGLEVGSRIGRYAVGLPSYYLSYSKLSPDERAGYLSWMAGGRQAGEMEDVFGLLFLAGVERRYFSDRTNRDEGFADAIEELRRLARAAPDNSKVASQIGQFLYASGNAQIPSASEPLDNSALREISESFVPDSLRLRLAMRVGSGSSLNAVEALLAVALDSETYPRTPFFRCIEEVCIIFSSAYARKYPQGVLPKSTKEQFEFRYRPANHSMYELKVPGFEVYDFRIAPQTLVKLRSFLTDATDALDAYSRRLASHETERGMFPAISLLPAELSSFHPVMQLIRGFAEAAVEMGGQLDLSHFAPVWIGWPEDRALSRQEREMITKALFTIGFASEPHWTVHGKVESTGSIIVGQLVKGASCDRSERFDVARLYIRFLTHAALSVQANGSDLAGRIANWASSRANLDSADQNHAALFALWCWGRSDQKLTSKEFASVPRESFRSLFAMVIDVAASTRDLSVVQVREIIRIGKTLGVPESDVYPLIHEFQSSPTLRGSEGRSAGGLDMSAIAAKIASSRTAEAILKTVFAEENEELTDLKLALSVGEPCQPCVNQSMEALLEAVLERPRWSIQEFAMLSKTYGMLPGAVLDKINEYSLDSVEELLLTEQDEIVIDVDVAEQLHRWIEIK